jgi:hypothetical protein
MLQRLNCRVALDFYTPGLNVLTRAVSLMEFTDPIVSLRHDMAAQNSEKLTSLCSVFLISETK